MTAGVAEEWLRMVNEREKMTPIVGYNIVHLLGYKQSGEDRLTLLEHVGSWPLAQKAVKEWQGLMPDDADNILIYPMKKRETETAVEFNANHDPDNGQFTGDGGGSSAKPVDFDIASKSYDSFKSGTAMTAFSFDPATNKAYSAANVADRQAMLKNYTDGKSDLFAIGVTNHGGELSRESHAAYIGVQNEQNRPLIGGWTDPTTGFEYTDISYPADQGMTNQEAGKIAGRYAQEQVLVITKDGNAVLINTKGEVVGSI